MTPTPFQYIIGIDPGRTGGVALMHRDGTVLNAISMPVMEDEAGKRVTLGFLKVRLGAAARACGFYAQEKTRAVIEKMIVRRATRNNRADLTWNPHTEASLNQQYGALTAWLDLEVACPWIPVEPLTWQRAFPKLFTGTKTAIHARMFEAAFKGREIHMTNENDGTRTACLIAEWGRHEWIRREKLA